MIRLFDANCRLGRGPADTEGSVHGKEALLSLMDDFNVEQAVVFGAVAQYSDPVLGNELLTRETEGCSRLLRQWAVLPALYDCYYFGNRERFPEICRVLDKTLDELFWE